MSLALRNLALFLQQPSAAEPFEGQRTAAAQVAIAVEAQRTAGAAVAIAAQAQRTAAAEVAVRTERPYTVRKRSATIYGVSKPAPAYGITKPTGTLTVTKGADDALAVAKQSATYTVEKTRS